MESTKYGENVLPGKGEIKAMKYTINLLRPVQTYTDIEIMARKVAKLGRRREMCKAQNAVFARLTGDLGRGFESRVTHQLECLRYFVPTVLDSYRKRFKEYAMVMSVQMYP